jgi:hypothetical protein
MGQRPAQFDVMRAQLLANLAELLVRQLEERWVASLRDSNTPLRLMRDASCYKCVKREAAVAGAPTGG